MEPHTVHGLIGIAFGLVIGVLGAWVGARRVGPKRRGLYRGVSLGILAGCITPYCVFVVLGHPAARAFLPLALVGFVVLTMLPRLLGPVPGAARGGVA